MTSIHLQGITWNEPLLARWEEESVLTWRRALCREEDAEENP